MAKDVQCTQCDREFSEDEAMEYPGKVHVHKGKVVCESCLVDMGVMPDSAEPYSLYIKTHTELGQGGVQ